MVVILLIPASTGASTVTTTTHNRHSSPHFDQNNNHYPSTASANNNLTSNAFPNCHFLHYPFKTRYVSRVKIFDTYSQVELVSDDLVEPVVKEEEVITKSTTELTTTKQIATRIKRKVVLEDGKIVDDSGPIIETNTTEDTDKKTSQETERRTLGDDADPKQKALQAENLITVPNEKGLYREVGEKTVISRKEQTDVKETEDVRHLGDFSDKAFVEVVNSGTKDIEKVLYSPEIQRQLVPRGPQIVYENTKIFETIDSEDKDLKYIVKPDGTLVTEEKKTTAHEEIRDEELPDDNELQMGNNETRIDHESSQRFAKQQDIQEIEYLANGKVIAKQTKYANASEQMERDGPKESPGDWDSLSDRLRKARRHQKFILNKNIGDNEPAIIPNKDESMKKIAIDYDAEEETRRTETNKWLESHFGSESRSSKDGSIVEEDVVVKPTKKAFFNVTIKSNNQSGQERKVYDTRTNITHRYSPEVQPIRLEARPIAKEFLYESNSRTRTPPYKSPSEERQFISERREEHRFQDTRNHIIDEMPLPKPVFHTNKSLVSPPPLKNEVYHRTSEESSSRYTSNEPQYVVGSTYSLASNSRKNQVSHETSNGTLQRTDPYRKSPRYGNSAWIDVHNELLAKANAPKPVAPVFQKYASTTNVMQTSTPNYRTTSPYNRHGTRYVSESDAYPTAPPRKRASQKKVIDLPTEEEYSSAPRSRSVSPNSRYRLKPKVDKQPVLDKKKRAESVDVIPPKKEFKVGSAIGNTFRKLIGKIRSASTERKLKSKSRSRTSSPQKENKSPLNSTYHSYQYSNNVDGHIDSERYQSTLNREHRKRYNDDNVQKSGKYNGDLSSGGTAKQRYYMGEDPYHATMYGKEDIYDSKPVRDETGNNRSARHTSHSQTRSSSVTPYKQNGYHQSDENGPYRTSQTLPRKLKSESRKQSASTINVSMINMSKPLQNTGPAKPARTKALNRSQSFNVNGMNGTVNHHPHLYEKQMSTPPRSFHQPTSASASAFKSNPSLGYGTQLQSPSIVSLISRSQRDLTNIPRNEPVANNKFMRYQS